MKKDISRLVRPNINALVPYSSARDEYSGNNVILLDANENPYNSPYNRYPDPHQSELKEGIAEIKNISADSIFVGNGSDEAIDLLFRVFCEPGSDNVVSISPTYGMYKVCADINAVDFRSVPLNEDFSLNTESLIAAVNDNTKLLFICSPNNPTANSFDPSEIEKVLEKDVIVILDEAYIDFSSRESMINLLAEYSNLVILQTFSKAWGLAGIRMGIAIANPQIIHFMSNVKYPYNINTLSLNYALEALKDEAKVKSWVSKIIKERKLLDRKLRMYRFVEKVYPSDANFLLVKVAKPKKVYNYLVEKGLIVRDRSNVELCEGSLRITIGSSEENEILCDALMNYQRDFVDTCDL